MSFQKLLLKQQNVLYSVELIKIALYPEACPKFAI